MQTVRADDAEVIVMFPGGIAVELSLAGKSIDISASVHGRPALVRADRDAHPRVTLDVVETRGPEE